MRSTRTIAGVAAVVGSVLGLAAFVGYETSDAPPEREPGRTRSELDARRRPLRRDTPTGSAAPSAPPSCVPDPTLSQPATAAPSDIAAAGIRFLADPSVASLSTTVSVWVDGYGEVIAHEPDLALAPASNEKIFTAMSALAVLGPDARLTTSLLVAPTGELAIVGGGDPTLTSTGPHSLEALVEQAQAGGLVTAASLVVDETRHDAAPRASGWQDWQIPTYTGPLSALMVDRNRWRSDPEYLADPALGNAERLRSLLAEHGVVITGPTIRASAPTAGRSVASLASPTVGELVVEMLSRSDNQIADQLLKEVGAAGDGDGSLAAGATAGNAALASICVPLTGRVDDGSGLSRANARSAREWRTLLQGARSAPWWPQFFAGLPLASHTGTLASRFGGTAAAGTVHAKTGTIIGGTALSGYGTTVSGRAFVFSVVANGDSGSAAAGAIDALVATLAAHTA